METPGAGELRPGPGLPVLVRHTAGGRIWTAYEHLRAHETVLGWADVTALHAIRIDAKRLRYTLESFREVLPTAVDAVIARIVALQDHLGHAQRRRRGGDHGTGVPDVQRRPVGAGDAGSRQPVPGVTRATVASLRRGLPAVWRPVVALPHVGDRGPHRRI